MCTDCDRTIVSDDTSKTGLIKSPDYPERYGPNLRCLYYLIGKSNERVQLFFEDFDVKGVLPRYVRDQPVSVILCLSQSSVNSSYVLFMA